MRYVYFADAICIINEQWSLKNNFPWIFPTPIYISTICAQQYTRFYLIKHTIILNAHAHIYTFTTERMYQTQVYIRFTYIFTLFLRPS